jgi:hypothetical protein
VADVEDDYFGERCVHLNLHSYLVFPEICIQPRIIKELICRASVLRSPLDHPLHELDKHLFLLTTEIAESSFEAKVRR